MKKLLVIGLVGFVAIVVLGIVLTSVLRDPASADFEKCSQLSEEGEVKAAVAACKNAVSADADSRAGRAAQEKLGSFAASILAECEALLAQDKIESAYRKCREAADLAPESDPGKKASTRASSIEADVEKRRAERAERERQRAAAALQALRAKIHREHTTSSEDDHCAGEGKPGRSYRYGGGTHAENDRIARADGCVAYSDSAVRIMGHAQGHYCCP